MGDRLWADKPPQYFTKPARPTQTPPSVGREMSTSQSEVTSPPLVISVLSVIRQYQWTTTNHRQWMTVYSRLLVTVALSRLVFEILTTQVCRSEGRSDHLRWPYGHNNRLARLLAWGFLLVLYMYNQSSIKRTVLELRACDRRTHRQTPALVNVPTLVVGHNK